MDTLRKIHVALGDISVLVGSFFIAFLIRGRGHIESDLIATHGTAFVILYILWLIILYVYNLYEVHLIKPNFVSLRQIFFALTTQAITGFLMFYFIPYFGITPKTTMLLNVGVFGILFIGWRTLFYQLVAHRFKKKLAIIGHSEEATLLISEITKNPHMGYSYVGNFNTLHELKEKGIKADILVVSNSLTKEDIVMCSDIECDTIRIFEAYQQIFFKIPVTLITNQTALKLIEHKDSPLYLFTRRIIEITISLFILIITLPISLITIVCIFLEDGGPFFYTQARVGKKKTIFKIVKFRSMIKDAEKVGAQWADVKDSRVTKVGNIIRKLHIDEIPQMYNVLRGDLALIGPRPERPEFVSRLEETIPFYFLRHTIKPGFTGWAQIKFRYARTELDSREKFEYDLFYLRNHNFFLDLGIILKTVQIIFTHE